MQNNLFAYCYIAYYSINFLWFLPAQAITLVKLLHAPDCEVAVISVIRRKTKINRILHLSENYFLVLFSYFLKWDYGLCAW